MPISETETVRINSNDPERWRYEGKRHVCPLFTASYEQTYLEQLEALQEFSEQSHHGIELLIIEGQLIRQDESYRAGAWIRIPVGHVADFIAGAQGAKLYVKTGHLSD